MRIRKRERALKGSKVNMEAELRKLREWGSKKKKEGKVKGK